MSLYLGTLTDEGNHADRTHQKCCVLVHYGGSRGPAVQTPFNHQNHSNRERNHTRAVWKVRGPAIQTL